MPIRLGGPVFGNFDDPRDWARAARAAGWAATTCPVPLDADEATVAAYRAAAAAADLLIAEVGAWSNPISPDPSIRNEALAKCRQALDLADRLGARCAVTIAGSRGAVWDGPHPDNFHPDTFDLIVETVRGILDDVQPRDAWFCLEAMPWAPPDGPEAYLALAEAIDRPRFGIHLDPVNMICTPRRALDSSAFLRECFRLLGPRIVNIHAKDFRLEERLTLHVAEVPPGEGQLDYALFLRGAAALPAEVGFVIEHLPTAADYARAADHVRAVAASAGVAWAGETAPR